MILPPLPLQPADDAAPEVWKAYIDAQYLRRQIEREDAAEAAMAAHRSAMLALEQRRTEAMERGAETSRLALHADLIARTAATLMADRSAASSSDATRAEHMKTSLADAITIADRALAEAKARLEPANADPRPVLAG